MVTLIVALLGPICGTEADYQNFKKPLFLAFVLLGVFGVLTLGLCATWLSFLLVFIAAKVGYSASLIFYDAMLNDVTTADKLDTLSSQGYAWGYIGSCVPYLLSLFVVLG